ncbi:ferritin-like domain-containing protein [Bradyrhizobium diversitatis]|uniref:Iminophenyl-pyruvate dimer synthase domain-containing protein n=1 Tax=Bradyrhizobium diversitatis TaxID=2755406 RepID=A0ABS0PBL0_9BRAD|nr:ferritin-like domain-containing protein [Bradyrhizobium diversitatis]MBH5390519.1 hypothetical protein [Bradyrhizobium diversitatis]
MSENVPVVVAVSAQDEAKQLLQAAAEIEHALLIQYLYAAFSVRPSATRKTLINIAIQEMSHFLAVQNLLLLLGADPYLERYDISPNPDLDPFPFGLKSLRGKETLEAFVLAEMPVLETLKEADRAAILDIKSRIDPQSKFHRVGILYARIYWLFQQTSNPEGDWTDVSNTGDIGPLPQWHVTDFPGAPTFGTRQASREEKGARADGEKGEIWWQDYSGEGAFAEVDSRATALRAIYSIAVQGEGLASGGANSHFWIFFRALKTHGELEPSEFFPVPENPCTSTADGQTEISHPIARALCQILNDRYQIMLVSVAAALRRNRQDASENERRQVLVSWAFYEMKYSIPKLTSEIVDQPCKIGGDAEELCAGPTFELGNVSLSDDFDALERENRALHTRAKQSIDALVALGFDADVIAKIAATDRDRYPDI